jgi:DNA modification methylase
MQANLRIGNATVYLGSNLDVLPTLDANSVDSIICDPPYELGFMGKLWDSSGIAYSVQLWAECLRVLKPGGHLLAFSGSRTYHRMTVAIEDAGFEIRDMISWISNKTFPKSHNVSKAISKTDVDAAKDWEGWGTALKPTVEPIVLARKPLHGTIAENVLQHGVGGLNIGATRIGTDVITINTFDDGAKPFGNAVGEAYTSKQSVGRWPANVILDEVAAEIVDEQGDASRFFYVARASKQDRSEGLETFKNDHPTVKPTSLMQYLIRLVTPDNGIVLDPFTGSGSTGKAAILEGKQFIGIELTAEYMPIIEARLKHAYKLAGSKQDE